MASSGSCGSGLPNLIGTGEECVNEERSETVPLLNGGMGNCGGLLSVVEDQGDDDRDQNKHARSWRYNNGAVAKTVDFRDFNTKETLSKKVAFFGSREEDDQSNENWTAIERCISASTRGFLIGAGLRGGISLFGILSRLKQRKKSSASGKSNAEAIKLALKETLRYGLFLSTFAGGFCTVDETIAKIGGTKRTAKWRTFVAGAVAGPSLLLMGHQTRHTSMAIYVLMRATVLAARCGIKSKKMGWLCQPLTWKYGDTFLMCLSSSQILSAWIMKPNSLPSSYISFLNKHGGKDSTIIHGIRALASKQNLSQQLRLVEQHYYNEGINVQLSPAMSVPCGIIHGAQDCVPHFFSFLGKAYLRSVPVYLPVYLVPAILVHRQGLLARPLPLLSKTILGTARSSLFLATYCASAWLWTCGTFRALGTCNSTLVIAGTFPTGLAVLIEKKSRRMELALYCFSRAIESFAIRVSDSGLLKWCSLTAPNRIDVVLFSLATSIIMHCHAEEREVFRSKYLNVLDWVFGVPDSNNSSLTSSETLLKQGAVENTLRQVSAVSSG